jgi:hypothetical protein
VQPIGDLLQGEAGRAQFAGSLLLSDLASVAHEFDRTQGV